MNASHRIRSVDRLVEALLADTRPRAKSLIVTVWGDAILPKNGGAWLGSVIELARPFGISERLVRTSVLRLSREDWLTSVRVGRQSYYSLTASGRHRFEDAHRRIFAEPHADWDGRWILVFTGLGGLAPERRERLRRELLWLGFGAVAPNVLAHPVIDPVALDHVLADLGAGDEVVVMTAQDEAAAGIAPRPELLRGCWDLQGLAQAYQAFLDRFRPLRAAVGSAANLEPEACFVLRALLVHEYRRVLLRDPDLPERLLPPRWPGAEARSLRRDLYALIREPARRHIEAVLRRAGPPPDASRVRSGANGP